MSSLDERSHTYVVRIWEERRDVPDAVPTWRGRVDDVRTGVRRYFTRLDDLVEYLSHQSGMANHEVEDQGEVADQAAEGLGPGPIRLSPSLRGR